MHVSENPLSAAQFFDLVVRPTNEAFYQANGDVRLAMLSSIITLHVLDYIAVSRQDEHIKSSSVLHEITREAKTDFPFRVVERFALASKHCSLQRSDLKGFHSNQKVRSFPAFAGAAKAGATFCGDRIGGISILVEHGAFANLTACLKGTEKYYLSTFPELSGSVDDLDSDQATYAQDQTLSLRTKLPLAGA